MRRTFLGLLSLAPALLILAGGCATSRPRWPAVSETPTNIHIQGRWIWAELLADNVETEKNFYKEVFGWQFDSLGTGDSIYTLVRVNDKPIAGIVHFPKPDGAERSARWLPIMSVPDTRGAADRAVASGGTVIVPPKELPGRGMTAIIKDPEGALFGVVRTDTGDPPDAFPGYDEWLWEELWAKNPNRMADFYRPIGDYTVTDEQGTGDRIELRLVAGGYPRAGILEFLRKDLPTTWLPYVRVEDLSKTVTDVERAGGRVVVEPSPEIRGGKVAVFLDPLGAAVAAAEWKDGGEGGETP